MLSGVDERVTKSDAETICAFHEGWLVDMDEGRGDYCKLIWLNNRNIGRDISKHLLKMGHFGCFWLFWGYGKRHFGCPNQNCKTTFQYKHFICLQMSRFVPICIIAEEHYKCNYVQNTDCEKFAYISSITPWIGMIKFSQ